jgi:hypothetical protein
MKLHHAAFLFLCWTCVTSVQSQNVIRFAVIGDFGFSGTPESDVATLVKSWNPEFVITTGDNNYDNGAASTIDPNIGQYYHEFISPYTGSYGSGDTVNRFFPSLGNHDWVAPGAAPYLNYFTLPGNERYYEFRRGPVHFFSVDSDPHEPDGITSGSAQGQWLQAQLAASDAPWKIVYFHHPPYSSSSTHGNTPALQWPFRQWGASIVLSGHDHTYERLTVDSMVYMVNGLGGKSIYNFGAAVAGSQFRYNANYGAQLVEASPESLQFRFYSRANALIETYTLYSIPTSVEDRAPGSSPAKFVLGQNFPNPFNPETVIRYSLVVDGYVDLKVYDLLGREVATLASGAQERGEHTAQWNAGDLPGGVYFYRLKVNGGRELTATVQTKAMVLMR